MHFLARAVVLYLVGYALAYLVLSLSISRNIALVANLEILAFPRSVIHSKLPSLTFAPQLVVIITFERHSVFPVNTLTQHRRLQLVYPKRGRLWRVHWTVNAMD
jgi:hypothetical protein